MQMKHLLILGAGPHQIGGIKRALRMGCKVTTLDNIPDNVGHQLSHGSVICSTTDSDGVIQAARRIKADGICTFCSDIAVSSVARAGRSLGLSGCSPEIADILSNKDAFRSFQQQAGLPHPRFRIIATEDELNALQHELAFPMIFKPVDASGSRGVTRLDDYQSDSVLESFRVARSFSRRGAVCVEEFVEGDEFGGDAFLKGSRFEFIGITRKFKQGFNVCGHVSPSGLSKSDEERIRKVLEETCQAVGYAEGPLNFDVILSGSAPIILEISPRNGGNGIAAILERSLGFSMEEAIIRMALGEAIPCFPKYSGLPIRGAGSWIFNTSNSGIFEGIADFEQVQKQVPELFDLFTAPARGSRVEHFDHRGNTLGFAFFDIPPAADYSALLKRVAEALKLEVFQTENLA